MPAVPDAARTAVVDRRQLTGKMKSTALVIGMSGTASPRRTIVLSLAKANSVILGVSSVRRQRSSLRSGLFCEADASNQILHSFLHKEFMDQSPEENKASSDRPTHVRIDKRSVHERFDKKSYRDEANKPLAKRLLTKEGF